MPRGTGGGSSPSPPDKIQANGSGIVGTDGAFSLRIGGEGDPTSPITLSVSSGEGVRVLDRTIALEDASHPISLRVTGTPILDISTAEGTKGARPALTGRVVDSRGGAGRRRRGGTRARPDDGGPDQQPGRVFAARLEGADAVTFGVGIYHW